MSKRKEAVIDDLRAAGANASGIEAARKSLDKHFTEKTYLLAVKYLGVATIILIVGAVASLLLKIPTSEALWTAVGAGLGGLAGIFTAKSGE